MFKSLFLLAMVTMPMTAFSQLPDGGIPVTLRAQTAAGVNKTAGFSSSIKKAELSTDIITEKPEGEEYTHCVRSGFGINQERGSYGLYDYLSGSYIKDGEGNVYLYNPIALFPTYTYIKLEPLAGDTLVCHTPQPVLCLYGDTYYATRLRADINESGLAYLPDVSDDGTQAHLDIKFILRNDSLYQVPEEYLTFPGTTIQIPSVILGLTDAQGTWLASGEANCALLPPPGKPTSLPAGVKSEPYNLFSFDSDNQYTVRHSTELAINGNDVYMTNPYSPDTLQWIHGTLNEGKVTFQPQYIGVDSRSNLHLSFLPATYTTQQEPDGTISYLYDRADKFVFDFDAEAKTLSTDSADNVAILINGGLDYVNAISGYRNLLLKPFPVQAATPSDPTIVMLQPYYDELGTGMVSFDFFPTDTENQPLPYTRLFYNLYLDDELLTVGPPDYPNVQTPFTNIPANYADNEYFFNSQEVHNVYLTRSYDKVGVQVLYRFGDQWYKSNLVSKTVATPNSIQGVSNKSDELAEQVWYDLSGRRVSHPAHGLYLKASRYVDGRVTTEKVMR